MVLQGQLEMEDEAGTRRLGPGDVFGLLPGLPKTKPLQVRALVKTKILAIEENELHMLALRHPTLMGRLLAAAAAAGDREPDPEA